MAIGLGYTANVGAGTTVTLSGSAIEGELELLNVNWSGASRGSVETTHTATAAAGAAVFGNRSYVAQAFSDPGEITIEFNFQPDLAVATKPPPVDVAAETITITWPMNPLDASASTWAATGFCTAFDVSAPMDDRMTCTMTYKLTGNVTLVDSVLA